MITFNNAKYSEEISWAKGIENDLQDGLLKEGGWRGLLSRDVNNKKE